MPTRHQKITVRLIINVIIFVIIIISAHRIHIIMKFANTQTHHNLLVCECVPLPLFFVLFLMLHCVHSLACVAELEHGKLRNSTFVI